MPPDEMRRLGYRVVDLVVDRLTRKHLNPAISSETPSRLRAALGGPVPRAAGDVDASIRLLVDVALRNQQHGDHPRYLARVPGPSSFAAVLGDWLATGFNAIAASWSGGSGPSMLELVVTEWLGECLGLPADTEGVLTSGGSNANLTAIAAARAARGSGIAYLTDQAHSCIARNLLHLGFDTSVIRILPSDAECRMPIDLLRTAVQNDADAGRHPLLVIATAGTTNTGAVDPLPEIAELCAAHSMWFHVDAAYGGPAALTGRGKQMLVGMERADSVVLDPHKWLFQPYDIACTLVTRPGALRRAFSMNPEYLKDVAAAGDTDEVDFRSRGFETTRRARAVKLWLTFRAYGVDRIREAIERGMHLAEAAEEMLRKDEGTWRVDTPAQLGILTFSLRGGDETEHRRIVKALESDGFCTLTTSVVKERSVLRLCTINPLTTHADLETIIGRLKRASRKSHSRNGGAG